MSSTDVTNNAAGATSNPGPSREATLMALLALTFSTGLIDAVGYLGLDRVFTGNMTGNVVILGMALVGADDLPVAGPAIALLAFGLGAAAGGRYLRRSSRGWSPRISATLVAVSMLLTAIALGLALSDGDSGPGWVFGCTGGLGLAMGLQAVAARQVAVGEVTTVVVTSTITALAGESRLGSATGGLAWRRRAAAVLLIVLGATCGAALLVVSISVAVLASAVVTLLAVMAVCWDERRTRRRGFSTHRD